MTIRRYNAWGWDHWLIYDGGALLFWGVTLWLVAVPTVEYSTHEKLWALLIPPAYCFAAIRLYGLRVRYAAGVLFVTKQGVSIHVVDAGGKSLKGPPREWVGQRRTEIENQVEAAARFWSRRANAAFYSEVDRASRIDDYLNGTHIEIVVTDEPIVNRRHNIKAAGLAYPKRLAVSLQPGEMTMGYPARFWGILEHETGHACLDALGVPQERHHVEMQAAGWGAA